MSDKKARTNRSKKAPFVKQTITFTGDVTSIELPVYGNSSLSHAVNSPVASTSRSAMGAMIRNMKSIEKTLINKNLTSVNQADVLRPD